jgi:hypothetical protein
LRDPAIPTPPHTATNEGAIAAVFATLRMALEKELLPTPSSDEACTAIRQLLLNAIANSEEVLEELPAPTETEQDEWELVLEVAEARILWDADYEMGGEFLDQPPEMASHLLGLARIDGEYFTAIPREPAEAGLIAARQTLARLVGRPVPNNSGLYPAIEDLYHHLLIGPCTQEEIDTWSDHPWIQGIEMAEPEWDCTYAIWLADFRHAVPTIPFTLALDGESALPIAAGDWPQDVRAELHGDAWVNKDALGDFWCDALSNGWAENPDEEMPMLTFSSREQAEAAYRQANQMYGERAARHEAAMAHLGQTKNDVD